MDPTSIVLAKVKGYPAWPAMVLDEGILPENVLKSKTKSKNIAVRFFSDDTYIWIKLGDLKPLSKEQIDESLSKMVAKGIKTKKEGLLKEAYELCQNPPDMAEFVRWGSKGPPEYIEEEPEPEEFEMEPEEEDEVEEPPKKRKKPGPKPKGKPGPKPKGKPGPKPKVKPGPKGKPGPKPKAKPAPPKEVEFDDDWGLEDINEYNYEEGNYIFQDEKKQIEFSSHFPSASEISESLNKYQDHFEPINDTLVDLLMQETINESLINKQLDKLSGILTADFPKSIFIKSALYKVMLVTLHKPQELFANTNLRNKISGILQDYLDLLVASITKEQLEPESNLPDPNLPAHQQDQLTVSNGTPIQV
ncbi:Tudor/PWWP/MBT [Hyphopichia burtonii NRRL Y-1933]|uniref:Tudor/PWWP/MBT n=1 Tax=Hyphopichia burtonii NRRL Y-1933 TaxID=984485 RepID=A0A1E4REF7_9ASCO|nr:Tudor/PWWP/MBT [Hyphopichia burtonii NRRL Y-1933]ODV65630.1 Tudor/PWWP/MBT [Hyphopichia burtonii NRRL Y-1933]